GYTQLMPATAFDLDPSLEYRDLFDRETNLRLGFRYLRWLIDRYDGDLRTALLAYNRGLGTVDSIRRAGGDPGNGYARAVMEGTR
ncbi:MAG: lytic transglycosylase domain-containing protein, partial [Longimicrobiales bacterium]|nr:lytic transglycosylase domain-containing protein [Longimicrobiales bacterium]